MVHLPFRDRSEAGRLLGVKLATRNLPENTIVLPCRAAELSWDSSWHML
jgi:predicted phosphoribosyltransferase